MISLCGVISAVPCVLRACVCVDAHMYLCIESVCSGSSASDQGSVFARPRTYPRCFGHTVSIGFTLCTNVRSVLSTSPDTGSIWLRVFILKSHIWDDGQTNTSRYYNILLPLTHQQPWTAARVSAASSASCTCVANTFGYTVDTCQQTLMCMRHPILQPVLLDAAPMSLPAPMPQRLFPRPIHPGFHLENAMTLCRAMRIRLMAALPPSLSLSHPLCLAAAYAVYMTAVRMMTGGTIFTNINIHIDTHFGPHHFRHLRSALDCGPALHRLEA